MCDGNCDDEQVKDGHRVTETSRSVEVAIAKLTTCF